MTGSDQHILFKDFVNVLNEQKAETAIIEKDGSQYTYQEFKELIVGAREELIKRGVKKGSKVMVFVPMSVELYAVLYALFSLGATTIFLDPWMKGKKMNAVIKQVEPELLVMTKKIRKYSWALTSTWKLNKWSFKKLAPSKKELEIEHVQDKDTAIITFTSGTSGYPKGASRSFAFFHAQYETAKNHLGSEIKTAQVNFTNFPIIGSVGFSTGMTVVIPRTNLMKIRKADAIGLIDQIIETEAERLIVSPSLLTKIIEGIDLKGKGNIQTVLTGGAPISYNLIKKCLEKFPDIKFKGVFGSTEAEPICDCTFQDMLDSFNNPLKGVYTGSPIDDIQLKIVKHQKDPIDKDYFKNNEMNQGEIGEVCITGMHVNQSYYKNPKAFKENKIVDEHNVTWHRTGDLGYLENGVLYLVGRDHRIVYRDGKEFHPYPIEMEIEQKFGSTDVGYIQQKSGKIVFFIGSSKSEDANEIKDHILSAGYPCDEVRILKKSLPRDSRHYSKLLIRKLIEK